MWMLNISWTEKVTDEKVLVCATEIRSILNTTWRRKHRWLGNVLRHDDILLGIIEGKVLDKTTRIRKVWNQCTI